MHSDDRHPQLWHSEILRRQILWQKGSSDECPFPRSEHEGRAEDLSDNSIAERPILTCG